MMTDHAYAEPERKRRSSKSPVNVDRLPVLFEQPAKRVDWHQDLMNSLRKNRLSLMSRGKVAVTLALHVGLLAALVAALL
jgi:hypothetical protein